MRCVTQQSAHHVSSGMEGQPSGKSGACIAAHRTSNTLRSRMGEPPGALREPPRWHLTVRHARLAVVSGALMIIMDERV